jgi:hypothetical protein
LDQPMGKHTLKHFVQKAELVWIEVFLSGKFVSGTRKAFKGVGLRTLSKEFRTRRLIYRFFRQYWSPSIARNMVCNLPIVKIKGKLFVLNFDSPITPILIRSLKILQSDSDTIKVEAIFVQDEDIHIKYRLVREASSGSFVIVERSGAGTDFRYQPCGTEE